VREKQKGNVRENERVRGIPNSARRFVSWVEREVAMAVRAVPDQD